MVTLDTALEAETSVLGAILIEPKLMGKAILALNDSDFRSKPNRLCWQVMRQLWSDGTPADPVLVLEKLKPLMESARGYVVDLMDAVPTCERFDYYLSSVRRQTAIITIHDIAAKMQDAQTMEELQQLIASASAALMTKKARNRMDARQMVESFAEDHAQKKSPEYLTWSMEKLRKNMDLEKGDLLYIAGRPSDGKTALSLQEAWYQAKTERVGFYSLETGEKKIRDRSLCNQIFIDRDRIKHNTLTMEDWDRYAAAAGELAERKIEVIEASGCTVDEIQADAVARNFTVVYIDYLQLIIPSNPRETNRVNAISDISRRLKAFGRQTGITINCICSLSRNGIDGDHARRPGNADLRESGQLEFDADAIMFVWRENPNDNKSQRKLYVSKNKEGETGEFDLYFDGKHQLFADSHPKEPESTYVQESFAKITTEDANLPF